MEDQPEFVVVLVTTQGMSFVSRHGEKEAAHQAAFDYRETNPRDEGDFIMVIPASYVIDYS